MRFARTPVLLLLPLMLNVVLPTSARAEILDFESLISPPSSFAAVPNGYGGVDWTDALVVDSQHAFFASTGAEAGATGRYVLLSGSSGGTALPIVISSGAAPFDFQSANVTASCLDNLSARFEGFQAGDPPGAPTYDQTISVGPYGSVSYVPEMVELVSLVVTPSGGSGGVTCSWPVPQAIVLDDVALNEPPLLCGNAAWDSGEECDGGLGCTSSCVCDSAHEPTAPPSVECSPLCGNASWDSGEQCDGGLACDPNCSCDIGFGPETPPAIDCVDLCGNGALDVGEECDGGADCAVDCGCSEGFGATLPRSLACTVLPAWVPGMREINSAFSLDPGGTDFYAGKIGASIAESSRFWHVLETEDFDLDRKLDGDAVASLLIPTVSGVSAPAYGSPATQIGRTASWVIAGSPSPLDNYLADGPEVSLVLLGQNDMFGDDSSGYISPTFNSDLRTIVAELLAAHSVPILVTMPPQRDREVLIEQVNAITRQVAADLSLPLNDYHAEVIARHPSDWDGTLIASDGVHPSAGTSPPNYETGLFTDANLDANGYALLNYSTLRSYAEVYQYVLTQPAVAVPVPAVARLALAFGLAAAASMMLISRCS